MQIFILRWFHSSLSVAHIHLIAGFYPLPWHFNHKMRNISIESQVFLDFRDIFFFSLFHSLISYFGASFFVVVVDRTWFILFWMHGCGKNLCDNFYRFYGLSSNHLVYGHPDVKWRENKSDRTTGGGRLLRHRWMSKGN